MTGWPVHVRGHRSLYYFLRPDEPHLFQYLKRNGYDVYWYGKNDLLATESFADSVTEWGARAARGKGKGNPWPFEDRRYYSFLHGEGPDRRDTGDWAQVEAAMKVLERESPKPFCIYLPLSMVHPPFTAPKDFYGMYDPAKVPALRPAGLAGKPNFHDAIRRTRRLDKMTEADFRQIRAVYLGMVSYLDWMFGELMGAVERTGHANDTAVFFFSDHGEWGGDYGLVEKWPSACDDVLTHVPVMARVPGVSKAGHVSREVIELYDVMATCLDAAGIQAEHTHFARSFMAQLRGERGDAGRAAFCEGGYNVNEPQCFEPMGDFQSEQNIYYPKVKLQNEHPETITRATMVRTLEWKLVARPDGVSELYDLARDPQELRNVYGQRQYAARQAELEKRMLDWYIRTADVAPKKHDPRGFPGRGRQGA
jgi:choline-sulfatase